MIEGSAVIERVFRKVELGDAEERLSSVAQKIEAVRALGQRGLANSQSRLILRQRLRMLFGVAVLVDVAESSYARR